MVKQNNRLFTLSLIVTLMCFEFLVLLGSTYAQNPPTDPQQTIILEIKEYAVRHVKNASPPQTQLIVDLYRSNNVGLTLQQIAKVYEEEYSYQRQAQAPGPFEQLRPHLGWIVAVLLAILLIFYKVIDKWVTALIETWGKWIHKSLAGRRYFRRFALSKYQAELIKKHENLKVAFSERPLKMRDIYVPLKMRGRNTKEQIDAYRAVAENPRLMIVGSPGSGKSMLLKHLAFAYAEGRLTDIPNLPIPILLELHHLNEKLDFTLEQHLVAELKHYEFPNAEYFVEQNLRSGSLLLLLDGLDEVNSSERPAAIKKIRQLLEKRRECPAVITCRNAVYNEELADIVNQTLEVDEFTDQQIRSFLRPWGKHMQEDRSIEHLLQTLQDRPRIMALARNPLMLTIIAYLYTDTRIVLPHSRAEFYRQSTDFLLSKWHQERNRYDTPDKQIVLEHLALFFQDSAKERQQDRRSVDYQTVMDQVKIVLPRLNLKPDEDVRPLLKEIVYRSDLLRAIDNSERYQFAHLTLQEYFAAERLLEDADGLFKRFSADPDTWRETVKLWCGLGTNSTVLIKKVYDQDPITAFECLADAKEVDPKLSEEIVANFKTKLNADGIKDKAIIEAFAAVASDLRPRGAAVFKFLAETLETGKREERNMAVSALSLTNLPLAAQKLAEHYDTLIEASPALIRMGDLAVPALSKLAQIHHRRAAINDLHAIGTPQAALALVPMLWCDENTLAVAAAYRLGALLSQPNIEEALSGYELSKRERNSVWYDWIWKPFKKSSDLSLPVITGRIGYLIDQTVLTAEPSESLRVDPRIIVPLFIQQVAPANLPEQVDVTHLNDSRYFLADVRSPVATYVTDDVVASAVTKLRDALGIKQGTRLGQTLDYLEPQIAAAVLYRCADEIKPTLEDWNNLNDPVEYNFLEGWHFQLIKALIGMVSSLAIAGCYIRISLSPNSTSWQNAGLFGLSLLIIGFNISLFITEERRVKMLILPFYYGYKAVFENFRTRRPHSLMVNVGLTILMFLVSLYPFAILYYGTQLMLAEFSPISLAGIWVIAIMSIVFLYRAGIRRDRMARNPLHGIFGQQPAKASDKLDTRSLLERRLSPSSS